MLVPFSSLLTFPAESSNAAKGLAGSAVNADEFAQIPRGPEGRPSAVAPSTSHLLCTTNYPAPSSFLAWHHARQTIQTGGRVVWIGCTAAGESHVLSSLRRAIMSTTAMDKRRASGADSANAAASAKREPLIYLDALDTLSELDVDQLTSKAGAEAEMEDARPALLRLQHRLDQILTHFDADRDQAEAIPSVPSLVVLEDVAALAWMIEQLTDCSSSLNEDDGMDETTSKGKDDEDSIDPRIKLLRSKRKQGATAIHRDEIGARLGAFIVDKIHGETCASHGAILLTHLTADSTSIVAPQARTQATRGGTYGVGTGFDADDAGEEDESEELYEEHPLEWTAAESGASEGQDDATTSQDSAASTTAALPARTGTGGGVASSTVDWRVDSVLRKLLLHADVWIEARGLRSGRARDCHGEICTYALARPCRALNVPLPELPLPADPLSTLRSQDRSAKPLTQFSRLSLAGTTASAHANGNALAPALTAFKMESKCQGRDKAVLFRIEPNGEAVAWNRGGTKV